jgi:hypothetical protein
MKTINVENIKHIRAKRYVIMMGILVFLSCFVMFNSIRSNKTLSNLNLTEINGIVETFIIEENLYKIELKNDSNYIYVEANIEVNTTIQTLKDNLKVSDVLNLKIDIENKNIYIAEINNNTLYDLIESSKSSNRSMILFYGFILLFSIVYIVLNIITLIKTPRYKEISKIEHILTTSNVITNAMLHTNSKTKQLERMNKVINYCLFASLVVVFIFTLLLKAAIKNQSLVLGIMVVIIALIITLVVILKPKFYSKHLDVYVNDYLDYLKNGNEKENEATIFFKKEGFKVQDNEKVYFFDYHELSFYTVAVYSKSNAPVNIFICSSLPEKEEYKDIQDFIIPLTFEIYSDIIQNGIYIEGLEELIKNLLNETEHQIKNIKDVFLMKEYKNM